MAILEVHQEASTQHPSLSFAITVVTTGKGLIRAWRTLAMMTEDVTALGLLSKLCS